MIVVTVTYPRGPDATFDFDYYEQTHLPLVAERWADAGLVGAEALRGTGAPGGEPPVIAMAVLRFATPEAMQAAFGGEHAEEIMGDIPKFTNVQPVVQFNVPIGGGGTADG